MKYFGNFSDRASVAREFDEGEGNKYSTPPTWRVAKDFPTDREILFASYEYISYEGYALVVFKRGGQLYEVNGSHCSCYGLEGQWEPEETTWEAIAMRSEGYFKQTHSSEAIAKLQSLIKRGA